ncbi:MAG: thiolase family protein [Elusimicrobia bacterium]|nr:thiolase family protein [Elusimicrobiota bacterium]
MSSEGVFIVSGARTPFAEWVGGKNGVGKPGGAFKNISAIELGAIALKEAVARSGVSPADIGHVVFGNALQTSPDAIYGARHIALRAGIPIETPALTVSRICGTGIEATTTGAGLIRLGEAEIIAVGGAENLSQAPYVVRDLRGGVKLKHLNFEDYFLSSLYDPLCGLMMAETAENLARKYGISREEQDRFALRSHMETLRAVKAGLFKEEIVATAVNRKSGTENLIGEDDHWVSNCSLEGLAKLKPYFSEDGFVTPGNASGLADGACALILASEKAVKTKKLVKLGRVVSWAAAGVAPNEMGMGPVPAIKKTLERAGKRLQEVDLFEINEAFAAQYLAVEKELGLERDRVNVNGGAIALGHPLSATGARLILTLLLELRRRKKRWGIASACIGGGQGNAVLVEALA